MTKDEIRELRERLGLTQSAFAMKCSIPIDTYRKYEQGVYSPSKRVALILSELDASSRKQAKEGKAA